MFSKTTSTLQKASTESLEAQNGVSMWDP